MSKVLSQEDVDKMLAGELDFGALDAAAPPPPPPPPQEAKVIPMEPPAKVAPKVANENKLATENPSNPEAMREALIAAMRTKLKDILDISLSLSVEIGRTKLLVQDLLQLHKGSCIELSNSVQNTLSILVNGKPVAKGEVVVVNERYGIRITQILEHPQLLNSLA